MKSVVLYFPFKSVGGVSTLFLRLSTVLSIDYDVYLVDYSDGFMFKNIPQKVKKIEIDNNPIFPQNAVYIFQSFIPWRFPFYKLLSKENKIIFWQLHPENLDYELFFLSNKNRFRKLICSALNQITSIRKKRMTNFVKLLIDKKAIFFCDRENLRAVEKKYNLKLKNPIYIPIPIKIEKRRENWQIENVLKVCWIGRLCDFKYNILIHTIERLVNTSIQIMPIIFTIIGDGEFKEQIKEACIKYQSEVYQFKFINYLDQTQLYDYLTKEVDVLFSMGTSALEGAKIGVPTFLTDYSYKPIQGYYKYKLFNDNYGYCVGEEITNGSYEDSSTLEDSLISVISNYEYYSKAIYFYTKSNFSMNIVVEKLKKHINQSNLINDDLFHLKITKPDLLSKIIRNVYMRLSSKKIFVDGFNWDS